MKKLPFAVALLGGLLSGMASADSDTGCGLGTMIWAGQSGVIPKILAVTTNGTSGNQTFGITTGTLGCSPNGVVTSKAKLGMFTGSNLDRLAKEMSVGQGETLNTLADLMQIPATEKSHFFALSKTHYDQIFSSDNRSAGQVLGALQGVMRADSELAAYAG